jgi:PAS domain S-box-containing protein
MSDSSNVVEQEGMVLHLADGTIQACNRSAQRILGVGAEQIEEWISLKSSWRAIAEDGSPILQEMHPAMVALRTGEPNSGSTIGFYQPNAGLIWLLVNSQPLFRAKETIPYAVVTTFTDLTKQKLADLSSVPNSQPSRLHKLIDRFALAAAAVSCLIYDWDLERNTVKRICGLTEIFGYQPEEEEPTVQWWRSLLHPEDEQSFNEQDFWQQIAQSDRFCTEYRVRHKDGHYLWVQDRQILVKDDSGKPIRIVGSTTDISDRKRSEAERQQAEEALLANLAILNAVNQATTTLIFVKDRQGRMLMANPATIHIIGKPEVEILGHTDLDFLSDHLEAERIRQNDRLVMESQQVEVFEETIEFPDGARTYLSTKSPYRDRQGNVIGLIGVATDITELKQTQINLQESLERLRLATAGGQLGMWFWDLTIDKLVWTDKCRELFGIAPDAQINYELFINSLHPDDRDRAREAVTRAQEGKEDYDIEYRTVWSDGSVHWIAAKAQCFYDASENFVKMMGTAQDITARKEAEEDLRRSEEFNRRILESSSDCIKLLDLNGHLLYMNTGGMGLMEIDDFASVLNTDWLCCWKGNAYGVAKAALTTAIAGELGRFHGYCPTFKQTPKWWDVVITPIRDAVGQVVQLLAISRDISEQQAILRERERAELRWRESEERLRLGMQVTGFGLAKFDYASNTVELSPEASALYGLGKDELIITRDRIHATFHPAERELMARIIQQVLDPNDSGWFAYDHRVVWQNGEVRWLSVRKQVFFDHSGESPRPRSAILVALDITDRKRAELEREGLLQQEKIAREAAERANRVKDEFLAILSHELRSPLNPILGWTQMMQTYQLDAEKTERAVATIDRNARLLSQLIDDLLDIARILRGKLSLNVAPLNLELVIEAAIETVQTAAEAKSIAIKTNFSPVGQIRGDFTRMQQIMWNLLTNAVKFTPDGGIVEIQLQQISDGGEFPKGNRAQISVSDTGKGISAEFLPHVFEYFRQADASVTRNHGGLGLGLAIVRHLVELHGGEVAVTSPGVGQGATFIVQLPLLSENSRVAAKKKGTTEAEIEPDLPSLQGIRVLVVDDDLDNRELITIMLKQYQAEVISVASAMEVSSVLKSFKPDILISDIGMPDIDGYTLLRSIRCLPPEQGGQIPAIAVTAYARPEDSQQALACGFQLHLSKPIDAHELVTAIAELVSPNQ